LNVLIYKVEYILENPIKKTFAGKEIEEKQSHDDPTRDYWEIDKHPESAPAAYFIVKQHCRQQSQDNLRRDGDKHVEPRIHQSAPEDWIMKSP
jgi:hypothetical protein